MSANAEAMSDAQSETTDAAETESESEAGLEAFAERVAEQFDSATDADVDVDVCAEQLAEDAEETASAYAIDQREALRSVANTLFDMKEDVSRDDYTLPSESSVAYEESEPAPADKESGDVISLAEIQELDVGGDEEVWPDEDIVANVVYLNDDHPDWLAQVGLLSDGLDDDDAINFNIYGSSAAQGDFDLEDYEPVDDFDSDGEIDLYEHLGTDRDEAEGLPVQVGDTVRIRDYVVESYEGTNSVYINGATSMAKLEENLDTEEIATIKGPISAIKDGSGLIERCEEDGCTRVLRNGECYEHGAVDGERDLRIKAVIETAHAPVEVVIGQELTEELTGIDLEEAEEMAKDALDTEVVLQAFRSDDGPLGETVVVDGTLYDTNGPLVAEDVDVVSEVPDPNGVLVRARAL